MELPVLYCTPYLQCKLSLGTPHFGVALFPRFTLLSRYLPVLLRDELGIWFFACIPRMYSGAIDTHIFRTIWRDFKVV